MKQQIHVKVLLDHIEIIRKWSNLCGRSLYRDVYGNLGDYHKDEDYIALNNSLTDFETRVKAEGFERVSEPGEAAFTCGEDK